MTISFPLNGDAGGSSKLVSIGSHRLCLYSYGPNRTPGQPVVIIVPGLASSITGWAAVRRLLNLTLPVYLYDRAGYGRSDTSPNPPTSIAIAEELAQLLQCADIEPPYILVAHSWGGILAREFLAMGDHLHDISGMVLVDANQERTLSVINWREPSIRSIAGKLDYLSVTGIRQDHKLTASEWREYLDEEDSTKHKQQAESESAEYEKSFPVLAEKGQLNREEPFLGERPLAVVKGGTARDHARMYESGVRAGYGTVEERLRFHEMLQTWEERDNELQVEALTLSRNSRYIEALESGHNVHLTEPEVIVDAIKWVFKQCVGSHL
ncbi:hypothetical protein B7463_g8310, partial [Scytalidium lignicola]